MSKTITLSTFAASLALGVSLLSLPVIASAQTKARLNPLIETLQSGGVAITPADWLFIDMEHGPYSIDKLQTTLADASKNRKANGQLVAAPIVRIPTDGDENSRFLVKQVLDSGAFGIVFPHIESREQALRAIQSMRYPPQRGTKLPEPKGLRGYGPNRAATNWGLPVGEYIQRADVWPLNPVGELVAIMMIESAEGVKNVREIMTSPGVGAILIGASDLGMSLGVGPANPVAPKETEDAVAEIVKLCRETKVVCAYPEHAGDAVVKKRIQQGFRMLMVSGSVPGKK